MGVRLKDIAKRSGFSQATVSMAVNNKKGVSEKTRSKILKISSEMNYHPNAIARGLATMHFNAIGVIVPDLASSYLIRILQGIKSTNRDTSYTVQLFDTLRQNIDETRLFTRLAGEHRIDGAIFIGSSSTDTQFNCMSELDVPTVLVAKRHIEFDCVYSDNVEGAHEAVSYLIGQGHKRIACIYSSKINIPTDDRIQGYYDALNKAGIEPESRYFIKVKNDTMQDGVEAGETVKELTATAVFVPAGDMVAIGVIKNLIKSGIRVPEEIAVIGYDDIPAAEVISPTLTTVRQPKLEMGDWAINLVTDRIEDRYAPVIHKKLKSKLIRRESA
ncbi:MAG: LacI family DNA-binding transcriptional regulator [Chitinivibrionales bacterium]